MPKIKEHALAYPTTDNIGDYVSREYARLLASVSRAKAILDVMEAAPEESLSGLKTNTKQILETAKKSGFFKPDADLDLEALAAYGAERTVQLARHSGAVGAIAILHSGFDRFLLGLCRIGAIVNRSRVLDWLSDRKISLAELRTKERSDIEDTKVNAWLDQLERESILVKWDKFMSLMPPPKKILESKIEYDRDRVEQLDSIRVNAVHGHGDLLKNIVLSNEFSFVQNLALGMTFHIALAAETKIDPRLLFNSNEFLW